MTYNPGVLVDQQIKECFENDIIGIKPFREEAIQPNSYDLHLSDSFVSYINEDVYDSHIIDPYLPMDPDIMEFLTGLEKYRIYPGEFVLASTIEYIKLPADICGILSGKSSLARLGLSIHQTGGFIDAGFEGQLTLELFNALPYPIELTVGMPIAQISFILTSAASNFPYGLKPDSKYQYQCGAQPSRYNENKKD